MGQRKKSVHDRRYKLKHGNSSKIDDDDEEESYSQRSKMSEIQETNNDDTINTDRYAL